MPEVIINGPEGRLETRYVQAADPTAPIALILHPEPDRGGHMNHPVTVGMYRLFREHGFSVLRFNFRGVGRSQGNYSSGGGELADAAVALDWLQSQCTNARACWIGGFSFGALIGMQLMMRRPEVGHFIAVTLPVLEHDFSFLAPCPSPGLVVHGTADSTVPVEEVAVAIEKMPTQNDTKITFRQITGANHYFTHHLNPLLDTIDDYIINNATPDAAEGDAAEGNNQP